jgi:hypothetical protein
MTLRRSSGLVNKLGGLKTNKLVDNANFATTTGWTASNATMSVNNNVLTVATTSGTLDGEVYQIISTLPGRTYKVGLKGAVGTAASFQVLAGASTGGNNSDTLLSTKALTDATLTSKAFGFVADDTTVRITVRVTKGAAAGVTATFSDIFVEEVLDGFQEIMRDCRIAVFSGAQPANADSANNGTLLYTITKDGAGTVGLTWGESVNGVVSKNATEVWRGTAVAGGTAGWFRCYESGDDPTTASSTAARFDGAIGTNGGEITMANTLVELTAVQSITAFSYTQPKQ